MEKTETELLGVQLTLVGLFLVAFFEGVYPYPLVGLLFGVVGTAVVMTALLSDTWPKYLTLLYLPTTGPRKPGMRLTLWQ